MPELVLMTGLLVAVLVSCNKKEIIADTPPYIEQWWDKYYGSYTVYDTAKGTSYQMEIRQLERHFENNYFFSDSILVTNFANKFDFRIYKSEQNPSNGLGIGSYFPKYDYDNFKWSFSGSAFFQENSDTIVLEYVLSNIAFYVSDGVPFYDCNCVDLAVKNE